ncbi:MAG: hypothetical protein AAF443_05425 [Chlamydiota bacterium]
MLSHSSLEIPTFCCATQQRYRTAAEILAAAATELFPDVQLLKGGVTPFGFYYDLVFDQPISREVIPLVEERMRHLIASDLPIQTHLMVPSNAATFLRHHGHRQRASFAEKSSSSLVDLFQLGSFVDFCPGSYLSSSREVGKIKIFDCAAQLSLKTKKKQRCVYRFQGAAYPSEKELKHFLRIRKRLAEIDHRAVGKEEGLFDLLVRRERGWATKWYCLWRQKGMEWIEALIAFGKKNYGNEKFEVVSHLDLAIANHPRQGKQPLRVVAFTSSLSSGEIDPDVGLYRAKDFWQDRAYRLVLRADLRQEIISSLKLIQDTIKILDLKVRVVLLTGAHSCEQLFEDALATTSIEISGRRAGKRAGILGVIVDHFGREWEGPALDLEEQGEGWFKISQSLFGRIERFLAAILESPEKQLSQKKDLLHKLKAFTRGSCNNRVEGKV